MARPDGHGEIVQETGIRTGRVLFPWNGADHVPCSAGQTPLAASASMPWDWFHINAVHLAWNEILLIDARRANTAWPQSCTYSFSLDGSRHTYLRPIGLPLSRAASPPGGGTLSRSTQAPPRVV